MRHILFAVNPISGSGDRAPLFAALADLDADEVSYSVLETTGHSDAARIQDRILQTKPDIVASVGGDGTLHLVADVLLRLPEDCPKPLLGIVPAGSANGLATELGLPNDPEASLTILKQGQAQPMDVIRLQHDDGPERYCLHIGDLGLNARLIRRFETLPSRGMWSYARSLWAELLRTRPRLHHLDVDGRHLRVRAHMIAFANASRYGTGAVINPLGNWQDGRFELVIVKPYPLWAVLGITFRLFFGQVNRSGYVDVIPVREAVISRRKGNVLQVDGEVLGRATRVALRIWPGALQVVLPTIPPAKATPVVAA